MFAIDLTKTDARPENLDGGIFLLVGTGLRSYSPRLGRWISRDPMEERGGLNLLVAGLNDLVRHVDARGNNPLIALPVIGGALTVAAAADLAATALQLGIAVCLATPACRAAVKAAVAKAIDELAADVKAALRLHCKQLNENYGLLQKQCSKCNKPGQAWSCLERVKRCAHGFTNALCFTGVLNMRLEYIVSGCDFVVEQPNWEGHLQEFGEIATAAKKCADQAVNNCTTDGMSLP